MPFYESPYQSIRRAVEKEIEDTLAQASVLASVRPVKIHHHAAEGRVGKAQFHGNGWWVVALDGDKGIRMFKQHCLEFTDEKKISRPHEGRRRKRTKE